MLPIAPEHTMARAYHKRTSQKQSAVKGVTNVIRQNKTHCYDEKRKVAEIDNIR